MLNSNIRFYYTKASASTGGAEQVGSIRKASQLYSRLTGSNLGLYTNYPDRFFVPYLSPSRKNLQHYAESGYDHLFPLPFKFIIGYYSAIRHYIIWVCESDLKKLQIYDPLREFSGILQAIRAIVGSQ